MRILVTAGPTREFIDPVRFISNRSSGKMGYAVARAAQEKGHEVILVSGPSALEAPHGVEFVRVDSATDMLAAVRERVVRCDALVMAAAVCDWRPAAPTLTKLRKDEFKGPLVLVPTPDVLLSIAPLKERRIFVGFAAETGDAEAGGTRKLLAKSLDMVVANDVSSHDAGFEVDTNRVSFICRDVEPVRLPLMSKDEVGTRIVEWIERFAR